MYAKHSKPQFDSETNSPMMEIRTTHTQRWPQRRQGCRKCVTVSRLQRCGLSAPQQLHGMRELDRMLVQIRICSYELICVKLCHATTTVFRSCDESVCSRCLKRDFLVSLVLDAKRKMTATGITNATSMTATMNAMLSPLTQSLQVYANVGASSTVYTAQSVGGRTVAVDAGT